jgi:hypothetical protein
MAIYPDRRAVLTGIAVLAAGVVLPVPALPSPPPELETLIGRAGMAAIAANSLAVEDGRFRISAEAREDLTQFMAASCRDMVVRLRGPCDAAAVQAIALHGPGFPGLSVAFFPRRGADVQRLVKMTRLEFEAFRRAWREARG